MTDTPAPSQDERVMAALAHGTSILFFLGLISPIIIWITQKDKSEYLRFQALQAIALQAAMILGWFLGMACYMCSIFSFVGLTIPTSGYEQTNPAVPGIFGLGFLLPMLVMFAIFGFQGIFSIYGLAGAVQTLRGRSFEYLVIGPRVRRYLATNGQTGPAEG